MLNDTVVTSLEEKRGTRLPMLWREAFVVGDRPLVVSMPVRCRRYRQMASRKRPHRVADPLLTVGFSTRRGKDNANVAHCAHGACP